MRSESVVISGRVREPSAVFLPLEYQGTIYVFGFLNLFALILAFILIPSELNQTDSKEEEEDEFIDEEGEEDLLDEI